MIPFFAQRFSQVKQNNSTDWMFDLWLNLTYSEPTSWWESTKLDEGEKVEDVDKHGWHLDHCRCWTISKTSRRKSVFCFFLPVEESTWAVGTPPTAAGVGGERIHQMLNCLLRMATWSGLARSQKDERLWCLSQCPQSAFTQTRSPKWLAAVLLWGTTGACNNSTRAKCSEATRPCYH